jgi:hypothetical protein
MNSKSSTNSTALRRLMTEYKQLTSGGKPVYPVNPDYAQPLLEQVHLMECSRQVETFRSLACSRYLNPHFSMKGPISESDFFTWEALICGPKDTPFVRHSSIGPRAMTCRHCLTFPSECSLGRRRFLRKVDVRKSPANNFFAMQQVLPA